MSDTDGIRSKGFNKPNFPANYSGGSEELKFPTDIRSDPTSNVETDDPTTGWKRGLGIGSPQA